jgi:formate dehydrogenase major subunit/NADH-quinone oxidoreductase subunit G
MAKGKVKLTIDGKNIEAKSGDMILWAALDAGIFIPNLCAVREKAYPQTGCRLCLVDIEGSDKLVTACSEPVAEGMVVKTNTERVNRIRHTAFDLLMSNHSIDCANCPKNKTCELQNIAAKLKYKLKSKRLPSIVRLRPIDDSHPLFTYNPNKCVLCGKCVWACEQAGTGELQFAFRGIDTAICTLGGVALADSSRKDCADCVSVCPVGALVLR